MDDGQFVSTATGEIADDDTTGGRMSLARDASQMSIGEVSSVVGVTPQTWHDWENDRAAPRANRLFMIAGVLQVSPTWLLCGKGVGPAWDRSTGMGRLSE
jgi:transcriptional regulator with XRE-family HTH domain